MSEDRKGFTVKDRRHFTAEGQVRSERTDEGPAVLPTATVEASPVGALPASRPVGHAVQLADLLVQLAGNASLLLGLAAREGEAPKLDLDGAREVIGILEMLREKTEGRRTPEEEKLLDGILYELRMSYVARTSVSGA
jgi:hypothetical protein